MMRKLVAAGTAALLVAAMSTAAIAQDLESVTIRFTWKYKGEYAPLFVALEKGYYKAAGLDVKLAEGSGSQTVMSVIASGEENIGYGPADAVASAVGKGMPLKVVGLYQTELPIALVSFPDKPVKTPKDLEGKRLASANGGAFARLLPAFAKANDVDLSKVEIVMLDGSVANTQFLSRQVDVSSPYLSNEVPRLEKMAGVELVKMPIADYGLPLLGASLFMSDAFIAKEPETVKKILAATSKGYQDAIANPQEATDIMIKYLPAGEDAEVLLKQVTATVESTNVIEGKPVGYQDQADWAKTMKLLADNNQVEKVLPFEQYFTNAFFE